MTKNLVQLFLQFLKVERQYSDDTITAYSEDLAEFEQFLRDNGGMKKWQLVDRLDVQVYLTNLDDQHYQRSSIARKISSLRSFFNFFG